MKKILVTGGCGFIASHLVNVLLKNNYQVDVIDNLITGNIDYIPHKNPHCNFFQCDVNNSNEINKFKINKKYDYVFHYAALVGRTKDIK